MKITVVYGPRFESVKKEAMKFIGQRALETYNKSIQQPRKKDA